MLKYIQNTLILLLLTLVTSCADDPTPKPNAFLRLSYPEANYSEADLEVPFTFQKNEFASQMGVKKMVGQDNYGVNIEYSNLKGTIFLTYKNINEDSKNLMEFIKDAQNFTQKHTIKADEIVEQVYINDERKVYGMFYEVGGNAASQSQFYVTDSVKHFLTGSLYFYAKPNYDSILPAAKYLERDIKRIMESVSWK
ncbi:gliding motility lipoprotein GldD [Formosa algae]|uniref:Gliding motility-associated lipoprotein GldD n=1 Tax=Formosa algae TaxID=225843 RepID=A0A9X1CBP8_9FLAO|nr:gliding motility lipoprotein GldD [Formosa algae]MBP1840257.1 gliding motility-associated lipoprotein GldD [Formosa algae]MDQ0334121.1 gliding motility-associated lipoprotein GldD [Formosa algae]OEI79446.1 gliding motility lipoprotein GldD [Formosa algae]PNW29469.1 gliding motility lipoprotein GldD [Formosa algae]